MKNRYQNLTEMKNQSKSSHTILSYLIEKMQTPTEGTWVWIIEPEQSLIQEIKELVPILHSVKFTRCEMYHSSMNTVSCCIDLKTQMKNKL